MPRHDFTPYHQGSRNPKAKLSNHDVRLIRELLPYLTVSSIAGKFDVAISTISRIKTGKAWALSHPSLR